MNIDTLKEKINKLIDKSREAILWFEASKYIDLSANSPFSGSKWLYPTILKMDFSEMSSLKLAFNESGIEYISYYINSPKVVDYGSTFSNCSNLKSMVGADTSSAESVERMCDGCINLETIREPFNFSNVKRANYCFRGADKLIDIRFVPETIKTDIAFTSSYLSDESVQSIIDGLCPTEDVLELLFNSRVTIRLTDEQLNKIYDKGWYVG